MYDNNLKINKKNRIETQPKLNEYLFSVNVFVSLFCIISFVALWRSLPQTIPVHWDNDWAITRYANRNEIFIALVFVVVFLVVDIIVYFAFKPRPYQKVSISVGHGVIAIEQVAYITFFIALYDNYLNNAKSFYIWFSIELIMCILLYAVTIVSIVIQSIKKSQPIQSSN